MTKAEWGLKSKKSNGENYAMLISYLQVNQLSSLIPRVRGRREPVSLLPHTLGMRLSTELFFIKPWLMKQCHYTGVTGQPGHGSKLGRHYKVGCSLVPKLPHSRM